MKTSCEDKRNPKDQNSMKDKKRSDYEKRAKPLNKKDLFLFFKKTKTTNNDDKNTANPFSEKNKRWPDDQKISNDKIKKLADEKGNNKKRDVKTRGLQKGRIRNKKSSEKINRILKKRKSKKILKIKKIKKRILKNIYNRIENIENKRMVLNDDSVKSKKNKKRIKNKSKKPDTNSLGKIKNFLLNPDNVYGKKRIKEKSKRPDPSKKERNKRVLNLNSVDGKKRIKKKQHKSQKGLNPISQDSQDHKKGLEEKQKTSDPIEKKQETPNFNQKGKDQKVLNPDDDKKRQEVMKPHRNQKDLNLIFVDDQKGLEKDQKMPDSIQKKEERPAFHQKGKNQSQKGKDQKVLNPNDDKKRIGVIKLHKSRSQRGLNPISIDSIDNQKGFEEKQETPYPIKKEEERPDLHQKNQDQRQKGKDQSQKGKDQSQTGLDQSQTGLDLHHKGLDQSQKSLDQSQKGLDLHQKDQDLIFREKSQNKKVFNPNDEKKGSVVRRPDRPQRGLNKNSVDYQKSIQKYQRTPDPIKKEHERPDLHQKDQDLIFREKSQNKKVFNPNDVEKRIKEEQKKTESSQKGKNKKISEAKAPKNSLSSTRTGSENKTSVKKKNKTLKRNPDKNSLNKKSKKKKRHLLFFTKKPLSFFFNLLKKKKRIQRIFKRNQRRTKKGNDKVTKLYNKIYLFREMVEKKVHFAAKVKRSVTRKMVRYLVKDLNYQNAMSVRYIINLVKTYKHLKNVVRYLVKSACKGKTVLFVGTSKKDIFTNKERFIKSIALECNSFYATKRWLGGLLTNWESIQRSIKKLTLSETLEKSKTMNQYLLLKNQYLTLLKEHSRLNLNLLKHLSKPSFLKRIDESKSLKKKESLFLKVVTTSFKRLFSAKRVFALKTLKEARYQKFNLSLKKLLKGIKYLRKLPDIVIILQQRSEMKAVKECQEVDIPRITTLFSRSDPNRTELLIPGNDCLPFSLPFFLEVFSEAIRLGKGLFKMRKIRKEEKRAEKIINKSNKKRKNRKKKKMYNSLYKKRKRKRNKKKKWTILEPDSLLWRQEDTVKLKQVLAKYQPKSYPKFRSLFLQQKKQKRIQT